MPTAPQLCPPNSLGHRAGVTPLQWRGPPQHLPQPCLYQPRCRQGHSTSPTRDLGSPAAVQLPRMLLSQTT